MKTSITTTREPLLAVDYGNKSIDGTIY